MQLKNAMVYHNWSLFLISEPPLCPTSSFYFVSFKTSICTVYEFAVTVRHKQQKHLSYILLPPSFLNRLRLPSVRSTSWKLSLDTSSGTFLISYFLLPCCIFQDILLYALRVDSYRKTQLPEPSLSPTFYILVVSSKAIFDYCAFGGDSLPHEN